MVKKFAKLSAVRFGVLLVELLLQLLLLLPLLQGFLEQFQPGQGY
jgi:hypothetical protein